MGLAWESARVGRGLEYPTHERSWTPRMGCGRDAGRQLLEQSLEKLKDLPSPPQDIKSGRSPLIHAVENNSLSMVQLLLQVRTAPPEPRAHPVL